MYSFANWSVFFFAVNRNLKVGLRHAGKKGSRYILAVMTLYGVFEHHNCAVSGAHAVDVMVFVSHVCLFWFDALLLIRRHNIHGESYSRHTTIESLYRQQGAR